MTNEQRLTLCRALRRGDEHNDYTFSCKDEQGEYDICKVNPVDGSWIDVESKDKSDCLDYQLYKKGVKARNKLTNILRGIRPE